MALDADPFMRTRTRGSPSWPTASPEGRIRLCRLLRPADHKPLADGAGHTFSPAGWRCRVLHGSSPVVRRRPAAPARHGAGWPTRPLSVNHAAVANTTSSSRSLSPAAGTATANRCVRSMNRMPVSAARSGICSRPPFGRTCAGGSNGAITAQRSSGARNFAMPYQRANRRFR